MTSDAFADIVGPEPEEDAKLKDVNYRLRIARIRDIDPRNPCILRFDSIVTYHARKIAELSGIDYDILRVPERLLLTRFYCSICGLMPFYYLNLRHLNRVRCGKCSSLINLRNSGKYGRIRKKIAITSCRAIDENLGYYDGPNCWALD